jgi:calcium-dependent protein kinase
MAELDLSLSTSGRSGCSQSCRKVQRWGDQSVKFSAKTFVAQNVDSLEVHYVVGELLGEGGFGEVYSCTHIQSTEVRAVKVIPKHEDEEENLKVIEEFDIVKDLDHPNILKMYALFESADNFFLVTDIYSGGELYDELAEFGRFDEEDAALLLNNVLSCILYCHKKGLVHRDLKPGKHATNQCF